MSDRSAKPPLSSPRGQAQAGRLSTPLWMLKHTQGIATTATAIAILHLRTAHVLYYTGSILATSFSAKGLKRLIKQPRPAGSRVKKTSGMPSTHSASVTFMGSYLFLHLVFARPRTTLQQGGGTTVKEWMLASLCVGLPVAVMWSRVRLGVHTPQQTVAGAALGVVKAVWWFTLWYGTLRVWNVRMGPFTNGLATTVGEPVDAIFAQWQNRSLP